MRGLKWCLFASYFAACLLAYVRLPERVPFHFGPQGVMHGLAGRSLLAWMALPVTAAVLLLAAQLAANWGEKHPEYWLIPEKRRLLCLSEARRAPIYAALRKFVDVMSMAFLLLFAAIQYLMYVAAVQGLTRFPAPFRLIIVGFSIFVVVYAVRFSLRLRRLILTDDPINPIRIVG